MKKRKSSKPWEMPVHSLGFPIEQEEGAPLTEIKLKPFTVAEHRAALASVTGNDSDDQFEAILVMASGLDEDVIEQIKRPDFVSLAKIINEYISLPASYFLERKFDDLDCVPLLVPIKTAAGPIDSLTLSVPSLKATKIMKKLKTEDERADFISAHCTGLGAADVQRLSVPDWSQLQDRLNDFLNKPADFFQSATLT